jgi:hypothetical protein
MPDNLLSKIKRSVIEGASCTAAKLEEAARIGRVKVDIIAEEHRLDAKYCRLGEAAFQAVQSGKPEALTTEPANIELVGAISENLARIQDLKEKLKALQSESCKKPC